MSVEMPLSSSEKRKRKYRAAQKFDHSSDMEDSDDSSAPSSSSSSRDSHTVEELVASGSPSISRIRKRRRVDSFPSMPPSRTPTERTNYGDVSEIKTSRQVIDPEYKYQSLPPGAIRILILHPGVQSSHLDCSLEVRNKGHKGLHDYDALSYVWGTEDPSHSVRIRRPDGGFSSLKITENLEAALRQMRDELNPRRFWIDAICIDQSSDKEKNLQVPMMSQIYSEASSVRVWIGKEDEHGPRALALMKKIRFLKNYDQVVEKETRCREWVALTKLMGQTWFSRRWVVQEIALARCATLHCGEYTIPWAHFAEAVTLFEEMEPRVRTKFRESKHYNQHPDFFGQVSAFSASKLVHVTNELVRTSEDGRILVKQMSLESLISRLTSFEATKPHDVIYGVLSLANDIPGSEPEISTVNPATEITNSEISHVEDLGEVDLTPAERLLLLKTVNKLRVLKYPVNYGKTFFEVCKDFLDFSMTKSRSLDILCRPWAPVVKDEKLPSWIRTLRHAPYGRRPDGYWTRKNPDTLVGQPGKCSYSASGKYPCDWQFGKDPESPSLRVKGFVLDIVGEIEDTARSGVIPRTWPKVCGWDDTCKDPPERFWRTMVGDRDGGGQKASQLYLRSCATIFSERVEDGDVDTKQITDRVPNTHLKNFAERLGAVVWNRRLTITERHELTGLTPEETQRGDLICILPGCSVPVVLHPIKCKPQRKLKKPYTEGERQSDTQKVDQYTYNFVGECFVYGMMDGEGFTIRNADEKEYEWFEIQ